MEHRLARARKWLGALGRDFRSEVLEKLFPPPFSKFRDIHLGEAMVVCGLGVSAGCFEKPPFARTIGVNDFSRRFDPDYLFVMDPRKSFSPERFRYIRETRARYVFSNRDLILKYSTLVRVSVHRMDRPQFDDPGRLYYIDRPIPTPYMGVMLAAHMGARLIGLIGVDLTENHFFASSGPHELTQHLEGIDARFGLMARGLGERGVRLFNLSPTSRLRSLPRIPVADFLEESRNLPIAQVGNQGPKVSMRLS